MLSMPRLVVVGVAPTDYLIVLREANRLKLTEGEDIVILLNTLVSSAGVSDLIDRSLAVIHTPGEVNDTRIPCAAMLSSRPVITTISFSQTEPVRHESTGILVKTRSPHLVAQAIDQIYNLFTTRHAEWTRMGQRGKQRVVTEFSIEMFGSRLDDILEALHTGKNVQPIVHVAASGPTIRARASSSGRMSFQAGLSELGSVSE